MIRIFLPQSLRLESSLRSLLNELLCVPLLKTGSCPARRPFPTACLRGALQVFLVGTRRNNQPNTRPMIAYTCLNCSIIFQYLTRMGLSYNMFVCIANPARGQLNRGKNNIFPFAFVYAIGCSASHANENC